MKAIPLAIGALLAAAVPAPPVYAQTDAPPIRNYEMDGNLESTHDLGCIPMGEAKASYNPVDLFIGAARCMERDEWESAAHLYALGGLYGRYDMRRVSDRSAHQAIAVAQMIAFGDLDDAQRETLGTTVEQIAKDPARLGAMCRMIAQIGPPAYEPRYMIQHGMGAFAGQANEVPKDFEPAAVFRESMTSYLHCPAGDEAPTPD